MRPERQSRYDWLLALVADGWDPIPSGSGDFLYLKRGEVYHAGVFTRWNLGLSFADAWFWADVERAVAKRNRPPSFAETGAC